MLESKLLVNSDEDLFSLTMEKYVNYRYSRGKYSQEWEEGYKFEILKELNNEFSLEEVNQDNIVEIVEKLQNANPSSGTFVHWSNLDDLKSFAKVKPGTVSSLFHKLFDEDISLNERISTFREKGKEYDTDISLGTPLFGYLLTAFDKNEYTIYKDTPFRDFADWFDFEVPSGVDSKYEVYLDLCCDLRDHFNEHGLLQDRTATLLDAQDFIFSTSAYLPLRFKIALRYLFDFSEELADYQKNPVSLLQKIKDMKQEYLVAKREKYRDSDKVRRIRYEILDRLLGDPESFTLESLQEMMERVAGDYEEDILRSWNEFKILFQLYFAKYKKLVDTLLQNIHKILRESIQEEDFKSSEVTNDFSWNQNFGSSRAWLALYPQREGSHRDAAQLFLDFDGEQLKYGLYFGDNVKTNQEVDLESTKDIEQAYLAAITSKYQEVLPIYREVNKNYWKISPGRNAFKWGEFQDGNYIAIGWPELDYPEKDIRTQIEEEDLSYEATYVEKQFVYFNDEMKPGDIVLAYGDKQILDIGRIEGEYYKEESIRFPHRREVKWLDLQEFPAEDLGSDFYDRVSINQTIVPIAKEEFIKKIEEIINEKSYFWFTISFKDLALHEKTVGTKVTFSPTHPEGWERRVIENIQKIKEGDKIIGYHTREKKHGVWCILEVQRRFEEDDQEYIEMEVTKKFDPPISKNTIVENSGNSIDDTSLHGNRVFEVEEDDFRNIVSISRSTGSENYFWATASPKIWTVDDLEEKGEIFYAARNKELNKRRIYGAFESASPGDKVIFYESNPTKYTKAIGEVIQGLHLELEEGYDEPVEGITIGFERNMEPVTWGELSSIDELEDSSPITNGAQGSLFELTEAEYDAILALEPDITKKKEEIPTLDLTKEIEIDELYFPKKETARLKSQISSAIENGKYIILIGPPGTGKSKLAKEICSSYVGNDYQMVTANSDWSTFDTIGGYHPEEDGSLKFQPGIFLESFKDHATNDPKNKWLILDEINRSDIDKAFGALFSALTGDEINLSFKADNGESVAVRPQEVGEEKVKPTDHEHIIPKDWRLIATMNTYDKTSLYEMSYAFMRRFAFIPVPAPKGDSIAHQLVEEYLDIWDIDDKSFSRPIADLWKVINSFRKVGPATIEDIYKTLLKTTNEPQKTNLNYSSALIMHVLPQFEGLLEDDITDFINKLAEISSDIDKFNEEDVQEISDFAAEYFQINPEKLPKQEEIQ